MGQREDLLAGAKKCLVEKGYSRTTARDIAAASGAHLASIGYHFGSKDNLMNTAVLEATSEWGDTIEAAVRAARAETHSRRLEVFLDELFAAIPRERPLLVATVQAYEQAQFVEEVRRFLVGAFEQAREGLAAMILGVSPEEVDDDTARGLGSLVYSLIVGYILQGLLAPEALPTAAQAARAVRTLADGGGARE